MLNSKWSSTFLPCWFSVCFTSWSTATCLLIICSIMKIMWTMINVLKSVPIPLFTWWWFCTDSDTIWCQQELIYYVNCRLWFILVEVVQILLFSSSLWSAGEANWFDKQGWESKLSAGMGLDSGISWKRKQIKICLKTTICILS